MKIGLGMNLAVLGWALAAQAQTLPDSPQHILNRLEEKAKTETLTRADVLDEVFAVQAYVHYFPSRETAEPYLYLVDDLIALAKRHRLALESLGTHALEELGRRLSRELMKWLNVFSDSRETVMAFHKWADPAAADLLLGVFRYQLARYRPESNLMPKPAYPLQDLKHAAENLTALTEWALSKTHPTSPDYLIHSYWVARGDVALIYFQISSVIEDQDIRFWIPHISKTEGYSKFYNFIRLKVMRLNEISAAHIHELGLLFRQLSAKLKMEPGMIDPYIYEMDKNTAALILTQILYLDQPFVNDEFEWLISNLGPDNLNFITLKWIRKPDIGKSRHLDQYFGKAKVLLEKLKSFNLHYEVREFATYFRNQGAVYVARRDSCEGSYRIQTSESGSRSRRFRLTLAMAKDDMLVAAATSLGPEHAIQLTFHHIIYDLDQEMFYATTRPDDGYVTTNWVIKFKFSGDSVQGAFINTTRHEVPFRGTREASFEDYFSHSQTASQSLVGSYQAKWTLGGQPIRVQLLINQFNEELSGRLVFGNQDFHVPLNIGSMGSQRGVFYLTSGVPDAQTPNWVQVRGKLDGDQLEAQYITGMDGLKIGSVRFTRMLEP
jgi:hypothetical protein